MTDTTDNITGEREVEAFQLHLEQNDPDYVTIRMRCVDEKPTIFVEWNNLTFPEEAVLSISPILDDGTNPKSQSFIFEKSEDVFRGLRSSPDSSANIVTFVGSAKSATIVAHLASGSHSVEMKIKGMSSAWRRVTRHCPIKLMPILPQ